MLTGVEWDVALGLQEIINYWYFHIVWIVSTKINSRLISAVFLSQVEGVICDKFG